MTRLERNANIAAVVLPFLGVLAAAVLLWNRLLGPRDLAIFAVLYLTTAIGITVGFHRLLTHRAFETHGWLRYTLAILGSAALQGSVIDWVADHRKHHTFPRSAFHGLRWYELDPSGWLILALAKVGLAWDVVRVTPERQAAKLAGEQAKLAA